jgi:hypothetical protein
VLYPISCLLTIAIAFKPARSIAAAALPRSLAFAAVIDGGTFRIGETIVRLVTRC